MTTNLQMNCTCCLLKSKRNPICIPTPVSFSSVVKQNEIPKHLILYTIKSLQKKKERYTYKHRFKYIDLIYTCNGKEHVKEKLNIHISPSEG